MADDGVALVEVEPRRTAVIAATVAWEEFPKLWRPMLDEVYVFVRQCPEFAAALEGTSGPHWTNVMLYRGEAPNVEVGVLAPSAFAPGGRIVASELPGGRAVTATHHGDPGRIGETHDRCASTRAPTGSPPPASSGRSMAIPMTPAASPPRCSTSSRLDFPGRKV